MTDGSEYILGTTVLPFDAVTNIEAASRSNLTYLDQLAKFHKQRTGANLNRFPSVDKRPLDLYKLKKFVEEKGGFDSVCRQKRWAEIGRELGYSGKIMSSLSTSLKNSYQKWLHPYEEWLKENKPRVLQQQELENGGPYTPSPAPTPVKAQPTPASIATSSPAMRASAALHATIQTTPQGPNPFVSTLGPQSGHGPIPAPVPSVESMQPRPLISSGFTAVNAPSSGFTAVNAPTPSSSFAAINAPNGFHQTSTQRSTPQRSEASPMTSAKNTPDLRPFTGPELSMTPSFAGQGLNSLKRQLSSDGDSGSGDPDASGRRSKRHRKGTFQYCLHPACTLPISCYRARIARHTIVGPPADQKANPTTCRCCADREWLAHGSAPLAGTTIACSPRSFR